MLWAEDAPATAVTAIKSADAKTAAAFRAECLAKAGAAAKAYSITVVGKNGWMFFGPELRHVGIGKFWGEAALKASQAALPANADPLPAILDFKAQLDKAGIELLLVPVPPKSIVYPDMASGKVTFGNDSPLRFDLYHQEFYDVLRGHGIAVLDLTPEFMAHRLDASGALYCKQDMHWSGRACVVAARRIVEAIKDRPWLNSIAKLDLAQQWRRIKIEGDLWQGLGDKAPAQETVPLRFVGTRSSSTPSAAKPAAGLKPLPPDRASPVILLGDSHDLVFHEGDDMHAKGAGLPDQLALELGFAVDLIAVRGSGATPARTDLMRRVRADSRYLTKKKLVIWCFSAREFTETVGLAESAHSP
jgi:alginate O-acetyltransferase complex protein AlgJ